MLYFWKICDLNDLLAHTLAKLSDEVMVDLDYVPPTATAGRHDKMVKTTG